MHRSFPLKAVGEGLSSAELCWSLSRTDHRISGKELVLELEAKGAGTVRESCRIERVTELTLQEEQAFDTASYPSLTAVWAETESVWELAKLYHSSPEAIGQLNEDLSARPLLIPKTN